MSEQIREQVSVFLDGELPSAETELLMKRLMRDSELRDCFGRYSLIGEAMRGAGTRSVTRLFSTRVNARIDGEPVVEPAALTRSSAQRWWRPAAGVAIAASVAALAMVVLERRADAPAAKMASMPAAAMAVVQSPLTATASRGTGTGEPEIYTVPEVHPETPSAVPAARLTSYVFAHSKYSSSLGQRSVISGLMTDPPAPVREQKADSRGDQSP